MTDAATKPAKTFASETWDLIKTIFWGLVIALILRVVLFEPFTIPSASMEPGLLTGDYIVATKWDYGWSRFSVPFNPPLGSGRFMQHQAHRGDVVVFRLPRDPSQTYVKRVIGVPGDKIQVRGGVISVNDQVIARVADGQAEDPDQPGLIVQKYLEKRPDGVSYVTFDEGPGHEGDDTDAYIVPEGHYFCMGDNRDNSLDSRWPEAVGVGFVPADNLVGKVRVVLVSWRGGASIFNPITWVTRFDIHRMFKLVK